MQTTPRGSRLAERFSDRTTPSPWAQTDALLTAAELYWITTVRADGRPHTTPLIGAWYDGAFHFASGPDEQKSVNLRTNARVTVTTGENRWSSGTDVVVEGVTERLREADGLRLFAERVHGKYGDDWRFEVLGDVVGDREHPGWVYRVTPTKVLTFDKDPHGQTAHHFAP